MLDEIFASCKCEFGNRSTTANAGLAYLLFCYP